jgi:hypothetical protein
MTENARQFWFSEVRQISMSKRLLITVVNPSFYHGTIYLNTVILFIECIFYLNQENVQGP